MSQAERKAWREAAEVARKLGLDTDQVQAIVSDYHLLGIGVRFSGCRNVVGSLAGDAVAAFCACSGATRDRRSRTGWEQSGTENRQAQGE